MSILASLARAYDRLPNAPPYGYATVKVGFIVSLSDDGSVANVIDVREGEGNKKIPKMIVAPQPEKRASGIISNFLWDKTAYVLGVTAGKGKRTAEEHQSFLKRHAEALDGQTDEGLAALAAFLRNWRPEQFVPPHWSDDVKDQNIVFCLERERLRNVMIHDRPAARALWARVGAEDQGENRICLVTGESGPLARLHPSIKNVWGAQSSGAAIVSFNLKAFTSYGHEQGDNAPVSEAAAFAYTTALNRFLERDSGHRIQIGDASTVFWADASDAALAKDAEAIFWGMADPAQAEKLASADVKDKLERIRAGKALKDIEPNLDDVRFYVLGLAPNAARLSIRFYYEHSFGALTRNYQRYLQDMAIEPPPREPVPPIWRYLQELAVLGKRENVPPNLAGEWMRSILTGRPYPLTLLTQALMRMRADGTINALRASILRAVLVRNFRLTSEAPVALDLESDNKGYLLGRLFATYEHAQLQAIGKDTNATIKDKYYGAASATPRRIFSFLDGGCSNHLTKLRKMNPGSKIIIERTIESIMTMMHPEGDPFPTSLSANNQALFGLGYYHQREAFFKKTPKASTTEE